MTGDRLSDLDAVERQRQFAVTFARQNGGRTFLRRQHVGYPFHVGRALYLPGDPEGFCTVYMQSCSGGIFQHERLGVVAVADPDAWAHLTTGAATVVHSMPEGYAEQDVLLDARAGSLIEYVPDALILFPDSRLDARLTIRAHRDATVIAAESFLLHDPRGDRRPFDWLRSETRVEDEQGRVLALDRFRVDGSAMQAGVPGVDGGFALQATLMVVHPQDPDAA
ncbi:MAG: urease accessory protein UreD, partial [Burkholderiales bacterium]|nr:urease accessory protein UreD [Burkholderiales bacterium]